MPKKIPLTRVGVQRNGVTIYPEIGKPFDFTKEEVADMDSLNKATKLDYIRDPVNEDGGEVVVDKTDGKKAGGEVVVDKTDGKKAGGKKADGENL